MTNLEIFFQNFAFYMGFLRAGRVDIEKNDVSPAFFEGGVKIGLLKNMDKTRPNFFFWGININRKTDLHGFLYPKKSKKPHFCPLSVN